MNSLQQQLKERGLARLSAAIEAACLPSIRLVPGKRSAEAVTRIGGRPNLPKGISWPMRSNGQPLSFIAQLNLSTLPTVPDFPLPKTGSLFFFYDAEEQPWGFDPADRGGALVIYDPGPLTANVIRSHHADLTEELRFKGVAVETKLESSLPNTYGRWFRDFAVTQAEMEAYESLSEPPIHRIGGNANVVQNELELQAQLVSNGIYCGDSKGYSEGRKRGLDVGAADWRLLLQVDSDECKGMMWGDLGRIYYMIRQQDLAQCRFDGVWLILQCG